MSRKTEGRYDYDGMCKPGSSPCMFSQETFSVSVFEWVKNRHGSLKKSKSVYRIYGWYDDPEKVYRRAEEVCDFLESGGKLTRKSEKVAR